MAYCCYEIIFIYRLKVLFGHAAPFDRHDWVVDRGGTEVRSIIDYYHDEANVDKDVRPSNMHDLNSMKSIVVDVRPALDSPTAIFDRIVRMPTLPDKSKVGYNPPPFFQPSPSQVALRRRQMLMNDQWSQIQTRCRPYRDKLADCDSEDSCGAASIALRKCSAEILCTESAMAFNQALGAYSQFQKTTPKVSWLGAIISLNTKQLEEESAVKARVETTLSKMDSCLDLFKIESQQLLKESQPNKSTLAQLFTSQK